MVVPAQLLELVGDQPDTGRAAVDSAKSLACSKRENLYACILSGGLEPIGSGAIAVFPFRIRAGAQHETSTVRIDKAEAVTSDGELTSLSGAEGTVSILPDGVSKTGMGVLRTSAPVLVSVSPSRASLHASQGVQFSAAVINASNTAVTWSLEPAVGTLFSVGYYLAPAKIGVVEAVTVTATSVADPSKSASAKVTLSPPQLRHRDGSEGAPDSQTTQPAAPQIHLPGRGDL
jgi:hypothetical protein